MSAGHLEARNQTTTGRVMIGSRGEGLLMSQRKRMFGRRSISVDKG
jgi:hypothetical protein